MEKLKKLFEKYNEAKNNRDRETGFMSEIGQFYADNHNPEIKKLIIDFLSEDRINERYEVWACVFEKDGEMFSEIKGIESDKLARESYEDYVVYGKNSLVLKTIVKLCFTLYKQADECEKENQKYKFKERLLKAFIDQFASVSDFKEMLELKIVL